MVGSQFDVYLNLLPVFKGKKKKNGLKLKLDPLQRLLLGCQGDLESIKIQQSQQQGINKTNILRKYFLSL